MVLSEFANRYLRMDFELWKKESKNYGADFKGDFVSTSRYIETVQEIKIQINQVLKFCEKASDNFNAIDINSVFNHFESIDFNDAYYLELAKLFNWKIVSDDKDFIKYTGHSLSIVTLI